MFDVNAFCIDDVFNVLLKKGKKKKKKDLKSQSKSAESKVSSNEDKPPFDTDDKKDMYVIG